METAQENSMQAAEKNTLEIVQLGNPVLRQVARELSTEEILSPEIQSLIQSMIATMRAAPGVGLAAPQIGRSLQLIVIEDIDHSHLTPEKLKERNRSPVPLHVVINPKLYIEETTPYLDFYEGCLSFDNFAGIVPRAESVYVECLNERAEPVTIHATGWYARILQHEIDHVNGIIYIDRAHLRTLTAVDNYKKHWEGKSIDNIKKICLEATHQEKNYAK